jgi:iron complex outermembrane receptor protein
MDLAGRYEYYSDFGGNIAGKLAARYKFSDKFSCGEQLVMDFGHPAYSNVFLKGQNHTGAPLK